MHRRLIAALTALALAPLTGCGGGSGDGAGTPAAGGAGTGSTSTTPQAAPAPKAFGLPPAVPTRPDGGRPDAVSRRVIDKWLGALSGGQVRRAARFFAAGSKVQNGTQVLTLRTTADRIIFNAAFPCGARSTRMQHAARGFTIVDFVLTDRVGGDCMGGAGGRARSAIRVTRGHIAEWYRLDTLVSPGATPGRPVPQPAPGAGAQIA